jgi:molybdenum cofactor cytidylyltransferase
MRLIDALRYSSGTTLAFVGAGGKTTALFTLARELIKTGEVASHYSTVLVTSTTHLGSWQAKLADHIFEVNSEVDVFKTTQNLPKGVVLVIGDEENGRLTGLDNGSLDKLRRIAEDHRLPLLVEADGSRGRPLKAPAEYEPAIPDFAQTVIVVAGLSGLGKDISDQWIHRPEIFSKLSGLQIGDKVSKEAIVSILRNKYGGLKNIPINARKIVLLNQADTIELQAQGKDIADQLTQEYHSIIISSLIRGNHAHPSNKEENIFSAKIHAVIEPVAGIILAAGGSSRFGYPKQLLDWKGQTFIRHVILAALQVGLSPVVVVVGDSSQKVIPEISNLPVRIVNNDKWKTGVSTSIVAGINALPKNLGAVIFLQADQPQVSPLLIKSLIEKHEKSLGSIIVPQVDGQRGNPVLFDLNTINDLLSLQGDVGGRALYSKFPIEWVSWLDPNQLLDVDNPEDYQKFLEIYPDTGLKP